MNDNFDNLFKDAKFLDYVTKITIPDSLIKDYSVTLSVLKHLGENTVQVVVLPQICKWNLYTDLYLIWNDKEFRYEIVNEIDYEKYPKYLWDENFEPRVFKFYEDLKDFVYDFIPYRCMPKELL